MKDRKEYQDKYLKKKAIEFGLTVKETVNKLARDHYHKTKDELKKLKDEQPEVYKYFLDNAWDDLMEKYLTGDEQDNR